MRGILGKGIPSIGNAIGGFSLRESVTFWSRRKAQRAKIRPIAGFPPVSGLLLRL